MTSLSKACFELSNTIKTFRLSRGSTGGGANSSSGGSSNASSGTTSDSPTKTNTVSGTITRAIRSATSRMKGIPITSSSDESTANNNNCSNQQPSSGSTNNSVKNSTSSTAVIITTAPIPNQRTSIPEIWKSEPFLDALFSSFSDGELLHLRLVHPLWKRLIDCRQGQYRDTVVVVNYRQNEIFSERLSFLASILQRGAKSLKLVAIADKHCERFCEVVLPAEVVKHVGHLSINSSNISDLGLEAMLEKFQSLESLKLAG